CCARLQKSAGRSQRWANPGDAKDAVQSSHHAPSRHKPPCGRDRGTDVYDERGQRNLGESRDHEDKRPTVRAKLTNPRTQPGLSPSTHGHATKLPHSMSISRSG